MLINTEAMVSISETNQNFSKVARLVDEQGSVVVLKNNVPRYLIVDFSKVVAEQAAPDDKVSEISEKLLLQNVQAYKELA